MSAFGYCGVDESGWRLGEELTAMSGSGSSSADARPLRMKLVAVFGNDSKRLVLTPYSSSLALRDVFAPSTAPASVSARHFSCECADLGTLLSKPQDSAVLLEALRDALDGYNRCILAYGEGGSGKSRALFGDSGSGGLCASFVSQAFHRLGVESQLQSFSFCISAWMVRGNTVFDLCSDATKSVRPGHNFTLVECPTPSIAMELIRTVHFRARSGDVSENRAHLMVRLVVHQARLQDRMAEGVVGSLLLCDLVGVQATSGIDFGRLPEKDRIARRLVSLNLQTLVRVFQQMREASDAALTPSLLCDPHTPLITAARDAGLTSWLCPILQGNTATTVLAFLVNDEEHFAATKRTLMSLEPVTHVSCAVYRCSGVKLSTLNVVDFSRVLTAAPHPDLDLSDDERALDLEKLAYGDYPVLGLTTDRARWEAELGDLMTALRGTTGVTSTPGPARRYHGGDAADVDSLARVDGDINQTSVLDSGVMEYTNAALLEEAAVLRGQTDLLRRDLAESRDEVLELQAEAQVRLQDYEMELARLKSLVRTLTSESDLGAAFGKFETEITRLGAENQRLHAEVSKMKLRNLSRSGDDVRVAASHDSFRSRLSTSASRDVQWLRRETKEKQALRSELESLRKKERLFALATRLADDMARKLRDAHLKSSKLAKELDIKCSVADGLSADLTALREDTDVLRQSHSEMRVERSRHLEELGSLRAALREVDLENRRALKLGKFAAKHGTPVSGASDASLYVVPGLSGSVEALYSRREEKHPSSPGIEKSLAALHGELSARAASLLPLLRNLAHEVYDEQARSIAQREVLVKQLYRLKTSQPV